MSQEQVTDKVVEETPDAPPVSPPDAPPVSPPDAPPVSPPDAPPRKPHYYVVEQRRVECACDMCTSHGRLGVAVIVVGRRRSVSDGVWRDVIADIALPRVGVKHRCSECQLDRSRVVVEYSKRQNGPLSFLCRACHCQRNEYSPVEDTYAASSYCVVS